MPKKKWTRGIINYVLAVVILNLIALNLTVCYYDIICMCNGT